MSDSGPGGVGHEVPAPPAGVEAAAGAAAAARKGLPPWAWALVGAAGAVIVIGAIAAFALVPALRSGPASLETTATVEATLPAGAVQATQTAQGPQPGAPGSAGSQSGSPGAQSSGSGTGQSGGSGGSKTATSSASPLTIRPKTQLSVLGWQKAYPADSNQWFYGNGQEWTQPFKLPAGKARVAFNMVNGGVAQVTILLSSLSGQGDRTWKIPGTEAHHTFYFETTTTAQGNWAAAVSPSQDGLIWQLRVERWGLP